MGRIPVIKGDRSTDRLTATGRVRARPTLAVLVVPAVLLVSLALRLTYLLRASPFVDEYSTLMAIQGIVAHGVPLLPSGFLYGHDPLYTYAATGAAILGSDDLIMVRLLSLLASLGAVALTYRIDQRLFSTKAGLLAAAFLALFPEAVLWGARARAYALVQLLTLVAFWWFYRGVERDQPLWRRLGLLALVAAVFTHPEAALLLPGLALAVLVLHGLRWWLHLDRLIEFALAGVGVIGRYLLQKVVAGGDVGGFNAIADARPTFDFFVNWVGGMQTVGQFLFDTPTVPATLLALLAILVIGLRQQDPRAYAVRFLALTLGTILLQMTVVIGGTWQSVRYLFFATPLLFLLAGAGFDGLAGWLTPRLPQRATGIILAVVGIVALVPSLPKAVQAANTSEIAHDLAFEYVSDQWAEGDRLATLAPAAAWLGVGRVDYFALGNTYEEFVWEKDAQWYDKWVGAALIHKASELEAVLDEVEAAEATLWLETDESRLLQRYDPDFVQTIWDRMSPVYVAGRAQVFRSQPTYSYAVEAREQRRETFGGQVALAGYAIGEPTQAGEPPEGAIVVQPGQPLPLRLDWQALSPLTDTYTVFIHLVGSDGTGHGQVDGLPLGGLYPMHLWDPNVRYPDRWNLSLPVDLVPGRYRLELGLYQLADGDRLPVTEGPGRLPGDALILDYLTVPGQATLRPPDESLDAEFGGAIRLLGVSPDPMALAVHPGDEVFLTLHLQVKEPTEDNYTLFIHVVGKDGSKLTQYDSQLQGGFYPTAFWDPGEHLEERVMLAIPPDAAPGRYQVLAGFYLLSTGDRLSATGEHAVQGDVILLGSLSVEE